MDSYLLNQKPGTIFSKATPLENDPAEGSQEDVVEDASEDPSEEYSDQLAEAEQENALSWGGTFLANIRGKIN
jgi:hypothetical protein